ncbi:hypothetical protein ABL78_0678 [Leptomonas seymouri]|uniref:Uncharacterized protein n=1 Tax=Leptomonas seymouri TaxID=5684 RepID=A0A0N1I9V9_LEPSE|nr:hypothetical protein ABL78_0678 [Leptomonas seymouri]|eukprot:KPI90160.1 hypothetical protein ABL78_0678 [Leptomonas seymouri]
MSNIGHNHAPPTGRLHLSHLQTGRASVDNAHHTQTKVNWLPRYTFDPTTLMEQSIEAELHRLYKGPAFDASPAHRYQTDPRRTYNDHQICTNQGAHRAAYHYFNGSAPSCDIHESLLKNKGMRQRRPACSGSRSALSSHHSASAFASAPPLPEDRCSRQRLKRILGDNDIEPVQNLVGMDGYFAERLHFSYLPLSKQGGAVRRTSTDGGKERADSNYLIRRGARGPASGLPHTSSISLPLANERPTTAPVAGTRGMHSHSRSALTSATAHAALYGIYSAPHPPASKAAGPPQSPAVGPESGRNNPEGAAKLSSALSFTATQTSSSKDTSDISSGSSEDVFFDEDALNLHLARVETSSPASPPRELQTSQTTPVVNPFLETAVSHDARKDRNALPQVLDVTRLPRASRSFASNAPGVASISIFGDVPHSTPAYATAPMMEERPPPSSRTTHTIAVELDKLAKIARRSSIDALIERLSQLRLQHQSMSHSSVLFPCRTAATSSSSTGKPPACRRRNSSSVRTQSLSAAHSRRSTTSVRRGSRLPRQPRHHSFQSASCRQDHSVDSEGDEDSVYVRLYRRCRRCECCEVPLPHEVARPQPQPPRTRKTVEGGRPHRNHHRLPEEPKLTSAPEPLECGVLGKPQEELSENGNVCSTSPPSSLQTHILRLKTHDEEKDVSIQSDQLHPSLTASIERELLRCITQQDGNEDVERAEQTAEVLRAFVKGLRYTAERIEADLASSAPGKNSCCRCGRESSRSEDVLTDAGQDVAVVNQALKAELLRLLSTEVYVPATMSSHVEQQREEQPQKLLPLWRISSDDASFSRPSLYATRGLLYPYNIPHPPHRDESAGTVQRKSGESQESAAYPNLFEEGKPTAEGEQPTAPSKESTATQQLQTHALLAEIKSEEAAAASLQVAQLRPMNDKSVQTSSPSSKNTSVTEKVAEGSSAAHVVAPKPSVSAKDLSNAECMRGKEALDFTFPSCKTENQGKLEEAVGSVSVARYSLSSFSPSTLAAVTPSVSPVTSEEAGRCTAAPTTATGTITSIAKEVEQQPPRDVDVQAAMHVSVMEVQLQLLTQMESFLRLRLDRDEDGARRDLNVDQLLRSETVDRFFLDSAESKERWALQSGSCYACDCIQIMEEMLAGWSDVVEEEREAWAQLLVNATAKAVLLNQRAEAKADVRELIVKLLYDEVRSRNSICFTEVLVRNELQSNLCEYVESYTREDISHVEVAAWLGIHHNLLRSAALTTQKAPSSMPDSARNMMEGAASTASSLDKQASDFVTSTNQSSTQERLSTKDTTMSCEVAQEYSRHAVAEGVPTAGSSAVFVASKFVASSLPQPVPLLGDEDEKEAAVHLSTVDTRLPSDTPMGAKGSYASIGEHDKADADNEVCSNAPPATAATAEAEPVCNCPSTVPAASGALALSSDLENPERERPMVAVQSQSAVLPSYTAGDASTSQNRIVVNVVKESFLALATSLTLGDVPVALPVTEMPFSPLKSQQRAFWEVHPANQAASKTDNAVQVAPVCRQGDATAVDSLETGLEAAEDEALTKEVLGAPAATGFTNCRTQDDSNTWVDGALAPVCVQERLGGTAGESSDRVADKQVEKAVAPATVLAEGTIPESQPHDHADAATPPGAYPLTREGTDSEMGSSRLSSPKRRRRRQRGTAYCHTFMADAIEIDEAGEIRSSEDEEEGNLDAGSPYETSATAVLYAAQAASCSQNSAYPPLWRVMAVPPGPPPDLNISAYAEASNLNHKEEKGDNSERQESQDRHGKCAPLEKLNLEPEDPQHSDQAALEVEDSAEANEQREEGAQAAAVALLAVRMDNNDALVARDCAPIYDHSLSVTSTELKKGVKEGDAAHASFLQAENRGFEPSGDNRCFLHPLPVRSEVSTPHAEDQSDDFSGLTPVSAKLSLEVRTGIDSARLRECNGQGFFKQRFQLPAALAQSMQKSAQPAQHCSQLKPSHSMSSLSSFSSRGKCRQDEEAGQAERAERVVEDRFQDDDDNTAPASSTRDASGDGDGAEWNASHRRSSCTGKDELVLMRERMLSKMRAREDHAVEPVGQANVAKIGHGFTKSSLRPRLSIDCQPEEARVCRTSHELSGSLFDGANLSNSSPGVVAQTQGTNHCAPCQHNEGDDQCVEDTFASGVHHSILYHDELAAEAVSISSPWRLSGNADLSRSRTQGNYIGSHDSDTLTPVSRRMRAECWEENGTFAVHGNLDTVGSPSTPEFVRMVLAAQLKNQLPMKGASMDAQETDVNALAAARVSLADVRNSDRKTETPRGIPIEETKNVHSTCHGGSSTAKELKVKVSTCEELSKFRGANSAEADDGCDVPLPSVAISVNSKAFSSGKHDISECAVPQTNNFVAKTTDRSSAASSSSATAPPQCAPPPWECSPGSHSLPVAEATKLFPLTQVNLDGWSRGTPKRCSRVRVRVPSPHPKALMLNNDNTYEESTSASADDDRDQCIAPKEEDTRFVTAMLRNSLNSEELVTAPLRKGVRIRLVDSCSDIAADHDAPQ